MIECGLRCLIQSTPIFSTETKTKEKKAEYNYNIYTN